MNPMGGQPVGQGLQNALMHGIMPSGGPMNGSPMGGGMGNPFGGGGMQLPQGPQFPGMQAMQTAFGQMPQGGTLGNINQAPTPTMPGQPQFGNMPLPGSAPAPDPMGRINNRQDALEPGMANQLNNPRFRSR